MAAVLGEINNHYSSCNVFEVSIVHCFLPLVLFLQNLSLRHKWFVLYIVTIICPTLYMVGNLGKNSSLVTMEGGKHPSGSSWHKLSKLFISSSLCISWMDICLVEIRKEDRFPEKIICFFLHLRVYNALPSRLYVPFFPELSLGLKFRDWRVNSFMFGCCSSIL